MKIKISKGIFYACAAAVMWAILAIALKVSANTIDSATIVWFRFSLAFLILLIYMLIRYPQEIRILYKPPWMLVVGSIGLAWNFYGYMQGVHITTPINAQIYIQIGPVLFALGGIFIYKEKITWIHLAGFTIVLIGYFMFYFEQMGAGNSNGPQYLHGVLLILSAGTTWAIYAILQKFLVAKYTPNQLNLFIFGFCSILFLPFAKFQSIQHLPVNDWLLLVHHSLNTIFAYGSIALAIKYMEANKVSLIVTLNPILTVIIMFFLGELGVTWIAPEHFSLMSTVGGALAISGAAFVVFFTRRNKINRTKKSYFCGFIV
ncbi:MAG: DMT family transporter [Bacteroidetes bacterium]|nr:DMT family transporter [Bacteroidota bacterium]